MNKFKSNDRVLNKAFNNGVIYTVKNTLYSIKHDTFIYCLHDDDNNEVNVVEELLKPALKITDLCSEELSDFIQNYNDYVTSCNYFMNSLGETIEILDVDTYLNKIWIKEHELREFIRSIEL